MMTNSKELAPIEIPNTFNYIGVFLTFACTLRCSYCINHHGGDLYKKRWMSGDDWIKGLSRIYTRDDLPITLQGGEPTVHKDFIRIVNSIPSRIPIDVLTNLEIPKEYFERIPPERLSRHAPYANIRVSYHHGQNDYETVCQKVLYLRSKGYRIGVWEVSHPEYRVEVEKRRTEALRRNIDWRLKEFLGPYKGANYGTMRYPDAVNAEYLRSCLCKTSELLIGPAGYIFRCHSDLYANRHSIGHVLDPKAPVLGKWDKCNVYGKCNSCDIKIKTNRFQEYGHSSVRITRISAPKRTNFDRVRDVENTYGRQDSASKKAHALPKGK